MDYGCVLNRSLVLLFNQNLRPINFIIGYSKEFKSDFPCNRDYVILNYRIAHEIIHFRSYFEPVALDLTLITISDNMITIGDRYDGNRIPA